jgi:hypothetical protein
MSGKLEGLRAISTNTTTNDYCIKQYEKKDPKNICTFCYSQEMLRTYRKNMANALQRNSDIIASKVLHEDGLPIILDAFFRFNAHGELINEINLINYINIALKNPHCTFSLWSKKFDIISKYFKDHDKPKNLILIYSNPKINHILEHYDDYSDDLARAKHYRNTYLLTLITIISFPFSFRILRPTGLKQRRY